MLSRLFAFLGLSMLTAGAAPHASAGARAIPTISIPAGQDTATVSNWVSAGGRTPDGVVIEGTQRYTLPARAGQHLVMKLTSSDGSALFTLTRLSAAGADRDPLPGAGAVSQWSGVLPQTGQYDVLVYTQSRTETSQFTLSVTLK